MVYPHNAILFGHKKEIWMHATIWMNLEIIMLSERSQAQKSVRFHRVQSIRTESRLVVLWAREMGGAE